MMTMHTLKVSPAIVGLPALDPICEQSVERLLEAVDVDACASVTVAGPLAGAAMSALWRRGVERVEAARRITSPSADQLSDTLLIVGCGSVEQVAETIGNVLPILAPGGILGIDASRLPAVRDRARLCRVLAHRGLRYRNEAEFEAQIIAYKPDVAELFALAS